MAESKTQNSSERLLPMVPRDPAWDDSVLISWTHPVLPDGSLGPARGVLTPRHPTNPTRKLTSFTLFPNLPFDLRVYIWRMTLNFERIVRVFEDIEYPDSVSEAEGPDNEEDENVLAIQALDKELNCRHYFDNNGQNQLEDHGFTSSRPKPELPTTTQLEHAVQLLWETTRVGTFYNPNPIPVLLHVCRESRQLLQSYGYKLAFSTRTAQAGTWFNFSSDVLYLHDYDDVEETSSALDGGMWNIGQFSHNDLDCLRKLSVCLASLSGLNLPGEYSDAGTVPTNLHKAVQLCGNLKELLIIGRGHHENWIDTHWYYCDGGEMAAVDLEIEELWGHSLRWHKDSRRCLPNYWLNGTYSWRFGKGVDIRKINYQSYADEVEDQIRDHSPCHPDRKQWTTPKVRFVVLMEEHEIGEFMKSREIYRRYIDLSYLRGVKEDRKNYRPPSPLSLTDESEALHELQLTEGYDAHMSMSWFKSARDAIFAVRGWPSPCTLEWIEASEVLLDMDSWPWLED